MSDMRIGQLARATGFSEKALRYYDQIGLLHPSGRSASGYRIYGALAVERLRFIRTAQDLGLSLNDIAGILEISDGGRAPCRHVLAVVERNITRIDEQLRRLRDLRRELATAKTRLTEAVIEDAVETGQGCPCLAR